MKLLDKNIALCLVPHPDDTAISMANLVKKFPDTIFHMVYMSLGTSTDPTAGNNRMTEENAFWNIFEADNIVQHHITNCTFDRSAMSDWVTEFDKIIKSMDAVVEIVFVPSELDSHYEHRLTNQLVYSISRFLPCTVIEYKTASSLHTWVPNFFVGISQDELDIKINCLRDAFKSQVDAPYLSLDSLTAFHTDFISMKRNYSLCEAFSLKQFYW